ncbi:hypothetical protein [Vibrio phage VP16T]|nr:hypothetical protein [Vibrio phage VP16T]
MVWQTRLREAAYTPPSGNRLTFIYTSVSEEFDQKGGPFDFAGADGTFVQFLGVTGRRYPMTIIVSGDDYDLDAAAWMQALAEQGEAILEHPAYGRLTVAPVGTVKRSENFVNGAGQATIEVTLFETTGAVYPTPQQDPVAAVEQAVADADAAAAAELAAAPYAETVAEEASFIDAINDTLTTVDNALRTAYQVADNVERQARQVQDSINRAIDVLVAQPLSLASQVQQLIQLPGRIVSQATARLSAYGDLAGQIAGSFDSDGNERPERRIAATRQQLYANNLAALSTATSTALASIRTEFTSQEEAIEQAGQLLDMLDDLAAWRDQSFNALNQVDNGAGWQATQQAVATAAGALVDISFGLQRQRVYVADRPRNIVELAYQLYGEVDSRLDELINNNNLSGDEIIEIPRGREVTYYE